MKRKVLQDFASYFGIPKRMMCDYFLVHTVLCTGQSGQGSSLTDFESGKDYIPVSRTESPGP